MGIGVTGRAPYLLSFWLVKKSGLLEVGLRDVTKLATE
jgi:hypothetical protein